MKKIPSRTIISFYFALVPVIVFVIFLIIGIVFGDVMGTIFLVVPVIMCHRWGIIPDILLVLAFIVLIFQIIAIRNFIHVRKKIRKYNENYIDEE